MTHVYYNKPPGREYIYLLLYVDDMLITSKSKSAIDKLKKDLSSEFEMKTLGEAKKVLGMEIERDRRSDKVSLTQKGYMQRNRDFSRKILYATKPGWWRKATHNEKALITTRYSPML